MKLKHVSSLFFVPMLAIATQGVADDKPFAWPEGIRAAVSLSYDDTLSSQLENAVPTLDKYGLKGSFYVHPGSGNLFNRLDDWRAIVKGGHELANHSMYHECDGSLPGREWQKSYHDLSKKTVEQVRQQLIVVNGILQAIDGKTERTYTAPCADVKAGGVDYIDAIRPDFVAAKTAFGPAPVDMSKIDPYRVTIVSPVAVSGKDLINIVKQAKVNGTMANITFHGIGGDHLAVSKEAHEELVKYLADHKDVYWTDSFINIMKYVKEQNK